MLRLAASQAFVQRASSFHAFKSIGVKNKLTSFKLFPFTSSFTYSASEVYEHPAQAVKGDTDVLLKGMRDKDTAEDVKRIAEMANRASQRREILHTDFLTPNVVKEVMLVLEKFVDLKIVSQGGYPKAERCRLSVGHPDVLTSDPDIVAALSISGNFSFEPCSHGDFLGSILGTGIVMDKVGDIILQAHVLVVPELVDFFKSSLDKVRNVSVTCEKIPLLALEYQPPSTKTLKVIEASLRLDAIASAGFKISRSKMASLISAGDVRVNWTIVTKNNSSVKADDNISVSGKGRLKVNKNTINFTEGIPYTLCACSTWANLQLFHYVGDINETKKGKFAVELIRYI